MAAPVGPNGGAVGNSSGARPLPGDSSGARPLPGDSSGARCVELLYRGPPRAVGIVTRTPRTRYDRYAGTASSLCL